MNKQVIKLEDFMILSELECMSKKEREIYGEAFLFNKNLKIFKDNFIDTSTVNEKKLK